MQISGVKECPDGRQLCLDPEPSVNCVFQEQQWVGTAGTQECESRLRLLCYWIFTLSKMGITRGHSTLGLYLAEYSSRMLLRMAGWARVERLLQQPRCLMMVASCPEPLSRQEERDSAPVFMKQRRLQFSVQSFSKCCYSKLCCFLKEVEAFHLFVYLEDFV